MTNDRLNRAIARARTLATQEKLDPRTGFDETQKIISTLKAAGVSVPRDLVENVAVFEADIVDQFFDNMPV